MSLMLSACGGDDLGWLKASGTTGNACPPVKRIVGKGEIESALDAKVNQGELSQFSVVLDVPTCKFDGKSEAGPASAAFAVIDSLGDEILEQFKEQQTTMSPLVVDDLGDEAVWFEQPRMLFVRKGSRLLVMQLFLTGPQFNRYRDRATQIAEKAVDRL